MSRLRKIICLTVVLSGCADAVPLTSAPPEQLVLPRQSTVVHSPSLWYDSATGFVHWDGTPPSGDNSPAVIRETRARAYAPKIETHEASAEASMHFVGDYGKIDLTYSETHVPSMVPVRNGIKTGEWTAQSDCSAVIPYNFVRSCQQSHWEKIKWTTYECDVRVTSGGTAYAKKGLPFGISKDVIKLFGISVGISAQLSWGETPPTPIASHSDMSVACTVPPPTNECDDPTTDLVETECDGESGGGSLPGGGGYVGEFATLQWPSPSGGSPPAVNMSYFCDVTIWRVTNNTGLDYIDIDIHQCYWARG